VTFDPHPALVHRPRSAPVLITGLEDRLERLAATGLDAVLVQRYTLGFAATGAEQFVRDWLVGGLRAATVVIGHDTKFGTGNEGDARTMRELGDRYGFAVEEVEAAGVEHDADGERERPWSSTWVRELLQAGDVAGAARVLGREHRLRGTVVHGDALGREIGFPTANLDVTAGMVPAHGVYAGWLTVLEPPSSLDPTAPSAPLGTLVGQRLPAAVSVGINYTVGGTDLRVEAHLIGLDGLDLYGAAVALDFAERRRDMLDFGSIEALVVALGEDVEWCRSVLGLPPA
jgi:riboflavin kinase/FMN adenylyltransferase